MDEVRRIAVYALFDTLGIPYEVVEHPPMHSQADAEKHRVDIAAVIYKNLFLQNTEGSQYYLLSLPLAKRADLVKIRGILGESRLSFGSGEALQSKLHISPGSVSLLNIIGKPDTDVVFLIDREVLSRDSFGVHPNDNTATILFAPDAIAKIFDHFGAAYRFVEA
ncbi:MAG: prolyl-tRNA synthetase associated domain-containing protein [Clostridiales bacterium]|nr:prolyl-tRNA synthetase associated domain-containing protein [Clostridiales bacterium]